MSGGRFLRIIGQTLVVSKSNWVRVADLSASLYRFEVYSNDSSLKEISRPHEVLNFNGLFLEHNWVRM
jgi:hypothetical protein